MDGEDTNKKESITTRKCKVREREREKKYTITNIERYLPMLTTRRFVQRTAGSSAGGRGEEMIHHCRLVKEPGCGSLEH